MLFESLHFISENIIYAIAYNAICILVKMIIFGTHILYSIERESLHKVAIYQLGFDLKGILNTTYLFSKSTFCFNLPPSPALKRYRMKKNTFNQRKFYLFTYLQILSKSDNIHYECNASCSNISTYVEHMAIGYFRWSMFPHLLSMFCRFDRT